MELGLYVDEAHGAFAAVGRKEIDEGTDYGGGRREGGYGAGEEEGGLGAATLLWGGVKCVNERSELTSEASCKGGGVS